MICRRDVRGQAHLSARLAEKKEGQARQRTWKNSFSGEETTPSSLLQGIENSSRAFTRLHFTKALSSGAEKALKGVAEPGIYRVQSERPLFQGPSPERGYSLWGDVTGVL